jgi:hypothetical protein
MDDTQSTQVLVLDEIAQALHDMCQPLTVLLCRLEIGQIQQTAKSNESTSVWTDCTAECVRLSKSVSTMQNLVRQARANQCGGNNERIGWNTGQ